jgi:TonB family protein
MRPEARVIPLIAPIFLRAPENHEGGGGGGKRDATPASIGRLPRPAPLQFTPPVARVRNDAPKLVMEPTLLMDAQLKTPADLPVFGDPHGVPGPPSDGPGSGGGIGGGDGTGVGGRHGPGFGQGDGRGGVAAAAYGRISEPVLLRKVDPDYSEQARSAKVQGMVLVRIDVDEKGDPENLRIARGLGLGLDEKALEAIAKWKFRPGLRDGRPAAMPALIEVQFRLL